MTTRHMNLILTLCSVLISVTIVSSNKIYAATESGLAISENDGRTWTIKRLENNASVNLVFVVGSRIFAAVAEGVTISDDDGRTWVVNTPPYQGFVKTTTAIYAAGNKVYAGTPTDLAVSADDGGQTWMNKQLPGSILGSVYVHKGKLYLGLSMKIAISDNDGKTFSERPLPYEPPSPSSADSICVSDTTIYVASGNMGKLFLSFDGGIKWSSKLLGAKPAHTDPAVFCSGRKAYLTLANGLAISEDNGETWTIKGANVLSTVYSIFATGDQIYVGTMDGLGMSINGGTTWTVTNPTTMNEGQPSASGVRSVFVIDTSISSTQTVVDSTSTRSTNNKSSQNIFEASAIWFSITFFFICTLPH